MGQWGDYRGETILGRGTGERGNGLGDGGRPMGARGMGEGMGVLWGGDHYGGGFGVVPSLPSSHPDELMGFPGTLTKCQ